jgi:hypothetical protein
MFLLTGDAINAQNYYKHRTISNPYYLLQLPTLDDEKKQYVIDNNIESAETKRYYFKKNGKKKSWNYQNKFKFNDEGQIITVYSQNSRKVYGHSDYVYNPDGKIVEQKFYDKNGDLKTTYIQHFEGVKNAYIVINDKEDTITHITKGLKDGNNVSMDYYYKKGKLKYRWKNSYNADGKVEEISLYKGNGKIKYTWDYRCKTDGAEILKHKDTTTICTNITQGDDSTTTYVYQYVDEKGELVKYINRMNKVDKLLHYRSLKGVNEVIQYEYDLAYDDDDSTVMNKLSKSYKKGILYRVSDESYNADHYFESKVITMFKKGAITSQYNQVYVYGENGLPGKLVGENKLKKTKGITKYQFYLK